MSTDAFRVRFVSGSSRRICTNNKHCGQWDVSKLLCNVFCSSNCIFKKIVPFHIRIPTLIVTSHLIASFLKRCVRFHFIQSFFCVQWLATEFFIHHCVRGLRMHAVASDVSSHDASLRLTLCWLICARLIVFSGHHSRHKSKFGRKPEHCSQILFSSNI